MIGTSLGPYRVLEPLGFGGMGEVYLAEDTRLGRKVAIKVLSAEFAGDPDRMARFEQEARATSTLNHPGICTLYDVGTHDGQPFLVMEALSGLTLRETVAGKALPIDRLLDIGIQVTEALGEAHDHGVIHRDLKSANVFITDSGRAKILDFGLAKLVVDLDPTELTSMPTSAHDGPLTREGATLGTVAYMSPEQARGQELDPRSDVFAFGVVLYEMATGSVPFSGPTEAMVFDQILNHDPPSPISLNPRLPTGLVRLIGKALQKDPAARYASAHDINEQLQEIRRAPGSLDSILPAEHVSSTAAVKLPPRPEEWPLVEEPAPAADESMQPREEIEQPPELTPPPEESAPPVEEPAPQQRLPLNSTETEIPPLPDEAPAMAPAPAAASSAGVSSPGTKPSIAVLPFSHLSSKPDDEFFCDGLADELINALTRVEGLDVAARTSTFQFKGKHGDVREIGEALGVSTVLEGSVRKANNQLRINAQLVKASDGYHLWSERFDRQMDDIFAIQDEIAAAIVETLRVRLVAAPGEPVLKYGTDNTEAYDSYLRGRHFWGQRRPDTMIEAIGHFERAIDLDPNFARAYTGLADAHAVIGAYGLVHPHEAYGNAAPLIRRALTIDDSLADAHFSQAWLGLWYSRRWWEAERLFIRACELAPRAPMTRVYYAFLLAMLNRPDEARAEAREALRLDPLSAFVHGIVGLTHEALGHHGGSYDEAIHTFERGLEIDAESMLCKWLLAYAYRYSGRLDRSIELAEQVVVMAQRQPVFLGMLGYFYGLAGRVNDAREILDEVVAAGEAGAGYVAPFGEISIHLGLGELPEVARIIEGRFEEVAAVVPTFYSTFWPDFKALRTDPTLGPTVRRLPIWPPEHAT